MGGQSRIWNGPAPTGVVDMACPTHHTDVTEGTWDGGANEKRLDSPMPVATARAMYGWYDSAQVDGGELPKAAAKLPHHEVGSDGEPGAANLNGVRNALARLPQSDIPDGEQDAVRAHLQAHLDDGDSGDTADDAATDGLTGRHRRLPTMRRPGAQREPAPGPAADGRAWYRIVNQDETGGPAEVWVYDEIGYWGVSADQFCRDLAALDAQEIVLRVNSPGGDLFDGLAIYNALVDHPATVTAKVDGIAASAASFIVQAADKIVMGRQAEMMIHDAAGLCIGNAADMAEMAAVLDRASAGIAQIYNDRAGGGVKAWRARMQATTWYSPAEAVAAGLADEMAPAPKRRAAPAEDVVDERLVAVARWDLSAFRRPAAVAASASPMVGEAGLELADLPEPAAIPTEPAPPAAEADGDGDVDGEAAGVSTVLDGLAEAHPPGAPSEQQTPPHPGQTATPAAVDTEPEPAAEPAPEPVTARAFPAGRPATAAEPEPQPQPDPWAGLVGHLIADPRPATVDQLLAHLRGDTA